MARRPPYRPSFEDASPPPKVRRCEQPGCALAGEYPAPKSRADLEQRAWFCLDHVREYNKAWNYLQGLDADGLEQFRKDALHGHRPTWQFGINSKNAEEQLQAVLQRFMQGETVFPIRPQGMFTPSGRALNGKERKALGMLELESLPTLRELKHRYKALVKRHHPDVNQGDRAAEERFKQIQEAFRVLSSLFKET